jgi:glyoxylase I family protein
MKPHHIAICVTDLKQSIDFYSKYFNFSIKKTFRKDEFKADFCLITNGIFEIELFVFDKKMSSSNLKEDLFRNGFRHFAFEVENLEETVTKLECKGLLFSKIEEGKSGNLFAFCKDPDGVQLELLEVVK